MRIHYISKAAAAHAHRGLAAHDVVADHAQDLALLHLVAAGPEADEVAHGGPEKTRRALQGSSKYCTLNSLKFESDKTKTLGTI